MAKSRRQDTGASLVEYCICLMTTAVVCLLGIGLIGEQIRHSLSPSTLVLGAGGGTDLAADQELSRTENRNRDGD